MFTASCKVSPPYLSRSSTQCIARALRLQALLRVVVHLIDQRLEAAVHQVALYLARRRDRLSFLLRVQLFRQDPKRLDLLDAGKLRVGALNLACDQCPYLLAGSEADEPGIGDLVAACPVGYAVDINLDQRSKIFLSVPENDGFSDVRARAQQVLDECRRDGLAARGHDEVAGTIHKTKIFVLPIADVAGMHPSLAVDHLSCCFRPSPIALEQVPAVDKDLTALSKLDPPAAHHTTDIAGLCKRGILAGNEGATRFRLAVGLNEIDAPYLPERRRFGRQRRPAGYHQLNPMQPKLAQNAPKRETPRQEREGGGGERILPRPAPSRACAPQRHGGAVGRALAGGRVAQPDQHLRCELLGITRDGEKDAGRDLKQRLAQVVDVLAEMRHEAGDQR